MTTSDLPPFSNLASEESGRAMRESQAAFAAYAEAARSVGPEVDTRALMDDIVLRPGAEALRAKLPVDIEQAVIGGVPVEILTPIGGVPERNAGRVLVNLHHGGLSLRGPWTSRIESIPIAALGGFRVVAVDFRTWPEHHFPAASEDVAAVYTALLADHPPANVGIFGCSAGGTLVGQAIAWFQRHGIPQPAAVGMLSLVGAVGRLGDSRYFSRLFEGAEPLADQPLPYLEPADPRDPLVSPPDHPDVLRAFPPSLLIAGTRDILLSATVHYHAQLVKAGVDARLHVWEGAPHCSFVLPPIADPDVPETREAWDVIVRFFDERLAR